LRRAGKVKKVYLIHQLNMNGQAGGILHVIGLAKGLFRQGVEVIVIAPRYREIHPGLPFHVRYLTVIPRPRVLKILSYELALAIYLCGQREIWTRKAVIYIRRGTLLLAPLLIAKILHLQSVVEENGIDWELELGKLAGIKKMWHLFLRRINKWVFRLASFVIVPTEGMKQYLTRIFPWVAHKTFVVANGVDTEIYHPRDLVKAQKQLKLSSPKRYVCYVGHYYPGRGLEILMEALTKIVQQVPNLQVLLVGDGPLRKALEEKVRQLDLKEHVLFAGFQPPTKASLYIAASEVCLAPYDTLYASLTSLSPLKLYSYMACARPVVISDVPIECKRLGEAARIVPPEQPDALAEAVIDLLSHPQEAKRMGERGREIVEEFYTWDIAAKKVLAGLDRGEGNCCEELRS